MNHLLIHFLIYVMSQSILFTEHLLCALSTGLHAAHVQEDKTILKELTIHGGYKHRSFDQVPLTARERTKNAPWAARQASQWR